MGMRWDVSGGDTRELSGVRLALRRILFPSVFSVQNAIPVVISFLFWKFEASLAIVLFLSVLAGVFIGVIAASHFRMFKKKQNSIDQEKEVSDEKACFRQSSNLAFSLQLPESL
jgi:uncharacterized integral membrane protein